MIGHVQNICVIPSQPPLQAVDLRWRILCAPWNQRIEYDGVSLLPRLRTSEDRELTPFNGVASWFWVTGDPPRPVSRAELQQALEAIPASDETTPVRVRIEASDDGFRVRGVPSRPKGGGMESFGDHRLAMLGAVAGLVSREGVSIEDAEAVGVSFPGFFDLLESVTQR